MKKLSIPILYFRFEAKNCVFDAISKELRKLNRISTNNKSEAVFIVGRRRRR